jgi:hypothetical protein
MLLEGPAIIILELSRGGALQQESAFSDSLVIRNRGLIVALSERKDMP